MQYPKKQEALIVQKSRVTVAVVGKVGKNERKEPVVLIDSSKIEVDEHGWPKADALARWHEERGQ